MKRNNNAFLKKFNASILFADLIGSMEFANYYTPEEYDSLLNDFQKHFWETIEDLNMYAYFKDLSYAEMKAVGDEASIFIPYDDNIANFLCVATDFKTSWLVSEYNIRRLSDNKPPIDVAIGINLGPVTYRYRCGWNEKSGFVENARKRMEGYTISIAKRLEGLAREGTCSRIIVSQSVVDSIIKNKAPYQFRFLGNKLVKGLSQTIPVYELKTCWNWIIFSRGLDPDKFCKNIEKAVKTDPTNVWLNLILADALALLRKYNFSVKIAKNALNYEHDNSQCYFLLAEAALSQRKYEEAASFLRQSIKLGGLGFLNSALSDLAYDGDRRFREFNKIYKFRTHDIIHEERYLEQVKIRGKHGESDDFL